VVVHGAPHSFGQTPDAWRQGRTFDHRALAHVIQNDPSYPGGPVRLISCETGAPGSTAAQNLSNTLGTEVRAPNDIIWAHHTGDLTIGPTASSNTGHWVSFHPQRGP
jgi:hypothetical protein